MTDTPITIYESALTPILRSLVTKAVVAAGAALVAHGFLSEDQANAAVAPVTQEIVGAIIALGSAAYAAWAAKRTNDKLVTTASAAPDSVAIVKGN